MLPCNGDIALMVPAAEAAVGLVLMEIRRRIRLTDHHMK